MLYSRLKSATDLVSSGEEEEGDGEEGVGEVLSYRSKSWFLSIHDDMERLDGGGGGGVFSGGDMRRRNGVCIAVEIFRRLWWTNEKGAVVMVVVVGWRKAETAIGPHRRLGIWFWRNASIITSLGMRRCRRSGLRIVFLCCFGCEPCSEPIFF